MRSLLSLLLVLWFAPAWAQVPMTGAGLPKPTAASGYSGPGDVFSTSPYAFYSCSRAYTAAYASGNGNMCRVTRTSDSAQCIIKAKSTGFADLTSVNCNGNTQTIVQFCNATTCGIDTVYDQTANAASIDLLQATAANQPLLKFNSSPSGTLPAIDCDTARVTLVQSATTPIQGQPITVIGTQFRGLTGRGIEEGVFGDNGNVIFNGFNVSNDLVEINLGGTVVTSSASDGNWHSVANLLSGASSVIKVDSNSETTGNPGTTGLIGGNIRLCRAAFQQADSVVIAEAGMWAATSNSTNRTNLNSNAHTQYDF